MAVTAVSVGPRTTSSRSPILLTHALLIVPSRYLGDREADDSFFQKIFDSWFTSVIRLNLIILVLKPPFVRGDVPWPAKNTRS
jgi:hypothetical protein